MRNVLVVLTNNPLIHMEKTKEDRMNDIAAKLQDVLNSQEALIDKTAEIQIDLLEAADKELEEAIVEIHTSASANHDAIQQALNSYQEKIEES